MNRQTGNLRSEILITVFFTLFAVGQLFFGNLAAAQEGQGDEMTVSFRWAFGALVGEGEEEKLEAIKQDTALKSGDQVKMLVELEKKCFIYVIHQNAQGELKLLFPYNLQQFATNYEIGQKYYVPQGDAWLRLNEQTGTEAFHLLASAQRMVEIENLWSQYESAEAAHKPEIGKLILTEIRNLKKQNRELTASVERPVSIGGNIRGITQPKESDPFDVATIADEISANNFYARAFTIDHQ